jgi:hypothetical protein
MKCREFNEQAAELTLAELTASGDEQLLAHQRECAYCATWVRQRQTLAGAMHALRNSTATLEPGVDVERAVLRAFRQAAPEVRAEESQPQSAAFTLSRLFGWGAYATVAAALAIALGLGVWYWQHAQKTSQSAAQLATDSVPASGPVNAENLQPATARSSAETAAESRHGANLSAKSKGAALVATSSTQSLAQMAQAQGYDPLMLCDPLSCSGEEQVVRMEIPANAVDASSGSEPLLADVVVGDDGLVRAIRIVQQ